MVTCDDPYSKVGSLARARLALPGSLGVLLARRPGKQMTMIMPKRVASTLHHVCSPPSRASAPTRRILSRTTCVPRMYALIDVTYTGIAESSSNFAYTLRLRPASVPGEQDTMGGGGVPARFSSSRMSASVID